MPKGFLFAEDNALKQRLMHLSVKDDQSNERPLQVFYRFPEKETEKVYPFVTIERVGLQHATNRQESEQTYTYAGSSSRTTLRYYPSEMNEQELATFAGSGRVSMEQPVPVDLMYQVTTYARNPIHDVQITALLLRRVLPFRRGFIEVPEDGTIRRLDLLNWQQSDIADQEAGYRKRIFRKIFTLSMSAEIPTSDLFAVRAVDQVVGTITGSSTLPLSQSASSELSVSITEDFLNV
jgi:hypothetical protein